MQTAIGVLVVARDALLRDTLRDLLQEAGYRSVGLGDLALAWEALQVSPAPLVVLVEHGDPRFACEALVAAAGVLPPHACVFVSTRPEQAPQLRNPHTRRRVPVVAIPQDIAWLTSQVDEACACLPQGPTGPGADLPVVA